MEKHFLDGSVSVRVFDRAAGEGDFQSPKVLIGIAMGRPHQVEFSHAGREPVRLVLGHGDIQLTPADLPHHVRWEEGAFALLAIDQLVLSDAGARLDRWSEPYLKISDDRLFTLCNELSREVWSPEESLGPDFGDSLARAVALRTAASLNRLTDKTPAPDSIAGQACRVRDFIEAHLAETITLEELAVLVDASACQVVENFRTVFGLTPEAYQIQRRFVLARELVVSERYPMKEVATRCGYRSQSHFTKVFRERFGMSPRAYQAKHRAERTMQIN